MARKNLLYKRIEPWAEYIKIIIQMGIGFILGILIILKGLFYVSPIFGFPLTKLPTGIRPFIQLLLDTNPIDLAGYALEFSSAFDLAYTLYTEGPDEAIDPLITGLAGTTLLIITKLTDKNVILLYSICLFLLVFTLWILFVIRNRYIKNTDNKRKILDLTNN